MHELKKTPLCDEHIKLGARMVDFAGWYMPVHYAGLREEHINVRTNVGLFDVSHMGEIRFKGPKALSSLEWLTTNDVAKLSDGDAQYSLLPNERGGLVDDIIVYCIKRDADYMVCVNASNKDKDFAWMTQNNLGAGIADESAEWAQIAVQGPNALSLVDKVLGNDASSMKPFTFKSGKFNGETVVTATTGYTGEKGCEIFVKVEVATRLWQILLEEGKQFGIQPAGLGARDTLRTEKKYSLYGHEINDLTNPYAAGLGWVIKPDKKTFLGRGPMLEQKNEGFNKLLVGFKMLDKGIPRQGYELFDEKDLPIGIVTSGTVSPSLNEAIGIAYITRENAKEGSQFFVDIRGRKAGARVCKTPFI